MLQSTHDQEIALKAPIVIKQSLTSIGAHARIMKIMNLNA